MVPDLVGVIMRGPMMGRFCIGLLALTVAVPALGAGLTDEVQQRRADELQAQQSEIRGQSELPATGQSLKQRTDRERWQRDREMRRFLLDQQQQRQRPAPSGQTLPPLQLQPSPADRAAEDTRRRLREIDRMQSPPPPSPDR